MGSCPNYYTNFLCHQDVMVSLHLKCEDQVHCAFDVDDVIYDFLINTI